MRHVYRAIDTDPNRLVHHGVKGQKWGVRRFENDNGTLASADKHHQAETSGDKKRLTTDQLLTIILKQCLPKVMMLYEILMINPTCEKEFVKLNHLS